MKKITLFAASVAVIFSLGVTSCSKTEKDVPLPPGGGDPSRLSFVGSSVDLYSSTPLPSTRTVVTENLLADSQIGASIVETLGKDGATTNTLNSNPKVTNRLCTVNGAGAVDITGDPIILIMAFKYDMYAYSPYNADITTENIKAIPVIHNSEVLWVKKADEIPSEETHSTSLIFDHKSAKVSFIVAPVLGQTIDYTQNVSLSVTGFHSNGSLDLETGIMTPTNPGATSTFTASNIENAETPTSSIFFLPEDGSMSLGVTVTTGTDGTLQTFTGTYSRKFIPGEACTVTISVKDGHSPLTFTFQKKEWKQVTGSVDVEN